MPVGRAADGSPDQHATAGNGRRPSTFDIFRSDVRRHIAFGHGLHFCLGASLGRLEGRIMLERVVSCLPTLRFAMDPAEPATFGLHGGGLALHTR